MVEIKPLTTFDETDFKRIASGYQSDACYVVRRTQTPERIEFVIELETLPVPNRVMYSHEDEQMELYHAAVQKGFSLGAYHDGQMVGVALAEHQQWNNGLWVWEFHVEETHRGQGIGLQLMDALTQRAISEKIRVIVCETQTRNVPAIRFYRKAGFEMDGVDLSYYSNNDITRNDVAVFMKKKL